MRKGQAGLREDDEGGQGITQHTDKQFKLKQMEKLGITKGEWEANWGSGVTGRTTAPTVYLHDKCEQLPIRAGETPIVWLLKCGKFNNQDLANAKLIAEAGTVANECGLTPRQLLDQRDELLEALKEMVQWFKNEGTDGIQDDALQQARSAIEKATK